MHTAKMISKVMLLVLPLAYAGTHPPRPFNNSCLNARDSQNIAASYADLIGNFTAEKAAVLLTDDFTDTSDSINILSNKPLGSVTFPSKQDFIDEQSQLPAIPLAVTAVDAFTCDTVVLRWTQTFGNTPRPVAGITVLVVKKVDDAWKFQTIFTEFNSIVYLENLGGNCTSLAS
ncbi:hypothetical protein F4778DRAFT_662572 [Xylariomycetidae sp. FL2044]|nr:hypothetical protein F4778DRAFT_662572 [Xylariomycetidae sp. FL2044]